MTDYLLQYSVILSWGINLLFAVKFLRDWWGGEPARVKTMLVLAVIALPAAISVFFLTPRGGYDNNHDYHYLGVSFFSAKPAVMNALKEYSPLLTDGVAEMLGGRSLQSVLLKNRLLPLLSIVLFFAGLRRLGAGLAAAAGGTALLFLNFLSLLNASSFSTTSANMFIWLLSLLALLNYSEERGAGAQSALWLAASAVLVLSSRFEFMMANALILGALLVSKTAPERRELLRPRSLMVLIPGAALAAVWAARALKSDPTNQLRGGFSPLTNLVSQLSERNLGVIAGVSRPAAENGLHAAGPDMTGPAAIISGLFLLAVFSGLLAGALADPGKRKKIFLLAAPLLLWIGGFSCIFGLADYYPLQFIRHQLYFFLPFAGLFALALYGFESAVPQLPGTGRKIFYSLVAVSMSVYAAANIHTALGLNRVLRTNDRELAFLMEARQNWPPGLLAVYQKGTVSDARAGVIAKYFPVMTASDWAGGKRLLKYVSPERRAFAAPDPPKLAWEPLLAESGGTAWRTASFSHAFYTMFRGAPEDAGKNSAETMDPVPLTIGFFELEAGGRDKAFLLSAAGAAEFGAGKYARARRRFFEAASEDPSCMNCHYLFAVSMANMGEGEAAAAILARIDEASPAALAGAHRDLVRGLAAGDDEAALAAVRELGTQNQSLFFEKEIKAGIKAREGDYGGGPEGAADRPLRAGEKKAKELSDLAVKKIRERDYNAAGQLLAEAMEKDGNNFEAAMNGCYLAGISGDEALGEEYCGMAVYLASFPQKHALRLAEGKSEAYSARASFHLQTGDRKRACDDLLSALACGKKGWGGAAAVSKKIKKHCREAGRAGAGLRAVREMPGHASLNTAQIYAHADKGDIKRAHSKFHPDR